jgi:hypothetical protein
VKTFYLGAHHPNWLEQTDVPLFVSRRVLANRKRLPRARGAWALDSGGFTELQLHGTWTIEARQYAQEVRRFRDEIGNLEWAAPQDWMCEPIVISGGSVPGVKFAGTKLSVKTHQINTVANLLALRELAPDLPIVPVLQGYTLEDYLRCWDYYDMAGIVLEREPIVGIGSVCRRQATREAVAIFERLSIEGLAGRMHGFGVKRAGLPAVVDYLRSADTQAGSFGARKRGELLPGHDKPGPGRPRGHRTCANCLEYLISEHMKTLASVKTKQPPQYTIWSFNASPSP